MTADNKVEPTGKPEPPSGGWNGSFYETPENASQRMYNAGFDKGRASSGDARVLNEAMRLLLEITFFHFNHTFREIQNDPKVLEVWLDFDKRAWKLIGFDPIEAIEPEYLATAVAKLSELRSTAKPAEDVSREELERNLAGSYDVQKKLEAAIERYQVHIRALEAQEAGLREALEHIQCHCQTYWENGAELPRTAENFKHYAVCQYPKVRAKLSELRSTAKEEKK